MGIEYLVIKSTELLTHIKSIQTLVLKDQSVTWFLPEYGHILGMNSIPLKFPAWKSKKEKTFMLPGEFYCLYQSKPADWEIDPGTSSSEQLL